MLRRFHILAIVFLLHAAAAGVAAAQSGWVKIASQTFDTKSEIAGFVPTALAAGTAIRLEAKQGNVALQAVVVTFGQGRVHVEERPIVLNQGERTRPIQISGSDVPVRSVEIVLAPGTSGKATIEVWALQASTRVATIPTATTPGYSGRPVARVGDASEAAVERTSSTERASDTPAKQAAEYESRRRAADSRSGSTTRAIDRQTDGARHLERSRVTTTEVRPTPAHPTSASVPTSSWEKSYRGAKGLTEENVKSVEAAFETLDACVAAKTCTPVPIFFGTNRNQTQASGRISFGIERTSSLQLGRVFVTVPSKNRAKGQLNVPGASDWLRGTPEGGDPKRHFSIPKTGIKLYANESDFVAAVKEHVASGVGTHKDHAFVYVHGYRVPWEFAAMRTAQIAYDLSPDDAPFGTPFLFSWPSQAAFLDYATDLEVSRISTPHLVRFLRMVVEKTGATHVHVIGHSMGNVPVMNALAEISRSTPAVKFSQVILAAPDVEKQEFADLAKDVVKIAKGVTLYASSSDIALLASRLVRRDKARAGDAKDPPGPSIVDGIDTIDISRLATGFMSYLSWNHDQYADSPVLLNDISTLFRTAEKLKPNQRNISFRLQQAPAIQARFWRYQD